MTEGHTASKSCEWEGSPVSWLMLKISCNATYATWALRWCGRQLLKTGSILYCQMVRWISSYNLAIRCTSFNLSLWTIYFPWFSLGRVLASTALTQQRTLASRAVWHYMLNRTRSVSPFAGAIHVVGQPCDLHWHRKPIWPCHRLFLCVVYYDYPHPQPFPALLCEFEKVDMISDLHAICTGWLIQSKYLLYFLQSKPAEVMSVDNLLADSEFYHNSLSAWFAFFFQVITFLAFIYSATSFYCHTSQQVC